MKLTNNQIYSYNTQLSKNFCTCCDIMLPVKINFFLQKNIQVVMKAGQEIEEARINIAKTFGTLNEDGSAYNIAPEKMSIAQRELNDLFNLEQDLNIHMFKLDDFDNIELTCDQMSAIMFMIEE